MPATLQAYRDDTMRRLGLRKTNGVTSMAAGALDRFPTSYVLSSDLFDLDRPQTAYDGTYLWIPSLGVQRRVRENGYRALTYISFVTPDTGTYYFIFSYFDQAGIFAFDDVVATVQNGAGVKIGVRQLPGLELAEVNGIGLGVSTRPAVIRIPGIATGASITSVGHTATPASITAQGAVGQLELVRPTATLLGTGVGFSLYNPLPVVQEDGRSGVNDLVNKALEMLWIRTRLVVTGTTSRIYPGSTLGAWLTQGQQVLGMYDPPVGTDPALTSGAGFRFQYNGAAPFLELSNAQQSGTTWYLDVLRPASTLVAQQVDYLTPGTTYADSTVGLVGESDLALPDVGHVSAVAAWLGAQELALTSESDTVRQKWIAKEQELMLTAAGIKAMYLPTGEVSRNASTGRNPWPDSLKGLWG